MAVMIAVPAAVFVGVTTPVAETLATPELLCHDAIGMPAGVVVAVNCSGAMVGAVAYTVSPDGVTETLVAVGKVTCTVAEPFTPLLFDVTVIVTNPVSGFAVTGCTRPLCDTVAIAVLLEAHVTGRLSNVSPVASFAVSVNWSLALFAICELDGATTMLATAAWETVTTDLPTLPCAAAKMVSIPGPTPVTNPDWFTDAIDPPDLVDQVNVTPPIGPLEPLACALTCWVPCVTRPNWFGVSSIDVIAVETLIWVVPKTPPGEVAVIVTGPPIATPVTVAVSSCVVGSTPPALTLAVLDALVDHVTVRPGRTLPFPSFEVAVTMVVWPTAIVELVVDTLTDPTFAGTTSVVLVSDLPPLAAMICTVPGD